MNATSLSDIQFHPTSFCDGNGRVFWSNGELYRGITPKCVDFTREIFANGIVEDLIAKKFIPRTELTDAALPGFPLVLHHETIPFVSYAYEWSPLMLRDAALFSIRMLVELAQRNFTLAGVQTWNILFSGTRPYFVDFSSIIDLENNSQEALWGVLSGDLFSYFLRPLGLFSRGQGHLARVLLADYEHGPLQAQFEEAIQKGASFDRLLQSFRRFWQRGGNALRRRVPLIDSSRRPLGNPDSYFMKRLNESQRQLTSFQFPTGSPRVHNETGVSPAVAQQIQEASPRSAMVIGGDDEMITLATRTGASVIAIDRDETRVDTIYQKACQTQAKVLPLVIDLRYPSPGYGVRNAVLAPALSRLRCDLVIALGLINSLVFKQRLQFEQIVSTFSELTLRTLIVDFPSLTNPIVRQHTNDPYFRWFGSDQFVGALKNYFNSIRLEPGSNDVSLIVCEKTSV